MECCEIFTCTCKCHLLLQLGRARITATVHQYGTEEGLYFSGVPKTYINEMRMKTNKHIHRQYHFLKAIRSNGY